MISFGRHQAHQGPPFHTGLYTVGPPAWLIVRPALPPSGSEMGFALRFGPPFHTGLAPAADSVLVVQPRIVRPLLAVQGTRLGFALRFGPPLHTGLVRYDTLLRGKWAFTTRFDALLRGLWRVEDTNVRLYGLYRGVDADPDFDAAPWETSATLPHTSAELDPSHTYNFVCRYRNAHNLESQNDGEAFTFEIDADGNLVAVPPSGPFAVVASAAASGAIRVQAWYNRLADGSNAATQWLIYQKAGSEPVPGVDSPTEVDMVAAGPIVVLDRTAGSYADGVTVYTLVRTRRVDAGPTNVDSTNTTCVSCTASTTGPSVPSANIFFPSVAEAKS